ncbi:hypothetical protein LMG33818_001532 [Halomonadaceae bacterium LMG 33818]|uniref:DUF4232 domain-containing protein n=1 Tax=Cernens ardua TaxID=3402176 RepID=UPI003EDC44FF
MQNNRHRFLTTVTDQNTSTRGECSIKAGKVKALALCSVGISAAMMLTACSKAPSHRDVEHAHTTPPAVTQSSSQSSAQAGASGSANSAGASAKKGSGAFTSSQMSSHPASSSASQGASDSASNASVSTCQPNELTLKRVSGDAGMGSVYEGIAFTNTGHHACILSGTPGVQRVTTSGEKIRPNVAAKPATKQSGKDVQGGSITLQPQQSAYVTLGLNNLAPDGSPYVPKQCKAARLAEVQFTWQGSHSVAHMKQPGYGCTTGIDKLQVQPFTSQKPAV